jgi:hypothetical protein
MSLLIQSQLNQKGKGYYLFTANADFQGANAFTTAALTRDTIQSATVPTAALTYPDYWPGHDGHL